MSRVLVAGIVFSILLIASSVLVPFYYMGKIHLPGPVQGLIDKIEYKRNYHESMKMLEGE